MATEDVGKLYPIAKKILTPTFRAAWKFRLEGLEHVPAQGGAILCPNHTSVLDSFFVPAVLPRRVTYVGKAEYMDDWKTRTLFPALGMIPIDREGGDAAERALATAQRVLERGELFGIYPEGTRSRDGRLYRGHTGPARLALRTGVPIVPIGISGAREVMPPDARFPKLRLPVTIRFGRPITVDRYQDRAGDRLVLRQIIDEVMYEIRELSGQEYVDEYATKKKKPEPSAPPTPAREATSVPFVPELVGAGGNGSGTTNGNGNGRPVEAQEPAEVETGEGAPDAAAADAGERTVLPREGEFVEATTPRSSADLLKRPVRRSPT